MLAEEPGVVAMLGDMGIKQHLHQRVQPTGLLQQRYRWGLCFWGVPEGDRPNSHFAYS